MAPDAVDRAADLLEGAGTRAAAGDAYGAAHLALEAAALLPEHDEDREMARRSAAQLLAAAAEAARRAGDWGRAAEAQRQALELATDELDVAVAAQNLAMTYKYTGRFDDAEQLYLRALAIAERHDAQPLVAAVCHNLGGLDHARGDHAAGIPWARRAVAVRESLGNDPVGLAADRGALAGLLIDAGELDDAEAELHTARGTFVEHLGPDDHEVAVIDGNLAVIALRRGDLTAAERRARRALLTKERCLGADHPELAVTLTTLGTIRRRRGDAAGAADLHRRALSILSPAVEPGHPLLRTIEENLVAARG